MLRFKEKLAGCTTPQKIVTYNHGFYKASALPPSHHGWIEIEVSSVKFRLGSWVGGCIGVLCTASAVNKYNINYYQIFKNYE